MISVVMPCWFPDVDSTAMNITEQAVESLGDVELVIIDNGSKYGSGWLNQKASVFLRFPENRGYTVAINRGIDLCTGDVIALVNNDIRVSPFWQEEAKKVLADPEVATVHPKMVDYEAPFGTGEAIIKSGEERRCQNSFVVTTRQFLDQFEAKEISGVYGTGEPNPGRFDENYGIGGGADDWDFAWRIHRLGGKRCYTDTFAFQHMNSFSLKKLGEERQKIVDQNNKYFISKWEKPKEELFREAGLI